MAKTTMPRRPARPALKAVEAENFDQASADLYYAQTEIACLGKLLQMASETQWEELNEDDLFVLGRILISQAKAIGDAANKLEPYSRQREVAHG